MKQGPEATPRKENAMVSDIADKLGKLPDAEFIEEFNKFFRSHQTDPTAEIHPAVEEFAKEEAKRRGLKWNENNEIPK